MLELHAKYGLLILVALVIAGVYKFVICGNIVTLKFEFMFSYLVPALLAASTDWLQGPYLYAIYQSYGYSSESISRLFLCGFASSMFFGTLMVSACGKYGPKILCMSYCVFCCMSCLLLHFSSLYLLIFGRICGGVATSLLFTTFEAWMIREHGIRELDTSVLNSTFEMHAILNSCVAIVSGLVSSYLFDSGGNLAPSDLAAFLCSLSFILIGMLWRGGRDSQLAADTKSTTLLHIVKDIVTDRSLLLITFITSLFEASMYIFIFMWTPILSSKVDFGQIFAVFMAASMFGSRCVSHVSLLACVLLAAISHCLVAMYPQNSEITFWAFAGFEFAVGIYFPAMGMLKAKLFSKHNRCMLYTLMRVPLNLAVLLLLAIGVSPSVYFQITTAMLTLAAVLCVFLKHATHHKLA